MDETSEGVPEHPLKDTVIRGTHNEGNRKTG